MTLKTAIIGSGNIGCDVLCKVQADDNLECVLVAGRSEKSAGLAFARSRGVLTTSRGFDGLMEHANNFELVFDATSAAAHEDHGPKLIAAGKRIINLTPGHRGELCIPTLNAKQLLSKKNINMVTCGGQASIPLAVAIANSNRDVRYIEVVSSISAKSAGPATRRNLSNYLATTEAALRRFTGCEQVKSILNINPAKPNVFMQTAVSALVAKPDLKATEKAIKKAVAKVRKAVPGYQIIVDLNYQSGRLFVMIRTEGAGDYLDPSAGNLDIITASATYMASVIARSLAIENAA